MIRVSSRTRQGYCCFGQLDHTTARAWLAEAANPSLRPELLLHEVREREIDDRIRFDVLAIGCGNLGTELPTQGSDLVLQRTFLREQGVQAGLRFGNDLVGPGTSVILCRRNQRIGLGARRGEDLVRFGAGGGDCVGSAGVVLGDRTRIPVSNELLPGPLPSHHFFRDLTEKLADLDDVVAATPHPKWLAVDLFGCQVQRMRPFDPVDDLRWPIVTRMHHDRAMRLHLVDGTYELFRYFFAAPSHVTDDGLECGAVRAVLGSMIQMLEDGATHIGIATDHVIESFRNELWDGYKDGSGIEPAIAGQFGLLEEVLEAAGFVVWPMIEHEADDALGAAAVRFAAHPDVTDVWICTPDKDLAQVVDDEAGIVQFDRRKGVRYDEAGVIEKFGVRPQSIPDYLGLVGDTADGFPGLPGWGAKSTSAVLARYLHIEDIPPAAGQWDITVRGGAKLAKTLQDQLDLALLFRRIATIELDADIGDDPHTLRWTGPTDRFDEVVTRIDGQRQAARLTKLV